MYSKNILSSGSVSIPKTKKEIESDYSLSDEKGIYREIELRNTHRDFGRFNRKNLWYPIYVETDGKISLDFSPTAEKIYPIWDDGFEGCWTWGIDKARKENDFLIAKNIKGRTKIFRKSYATLDGGTPLKQVKLIWNNKSFYTENGQRSINNLFKLKEKIFQSPKSVDMLMQCIRMSQDKNAIILDFFSGSATTAHAVMQLNTEDGGHRKFIMVQLPEPCGEKTEAYKAGYKNICEIGKERIRRAGNKIKSEHPDADLDIGFRVFRVDESNMKDVYYHPEEVQQQDLFDQVSNIKEDRTDLDLLYACLLDWGVAIHLSHTSEVIVGCTVHDVDSGALLACFDEQVPGRRGGIHGEEAAAARGLPRQRLCQRCGEDQCVGDL